MKKILSFITDGENFLALRNNFQDSEKQGGDFWFVVTGEVEDKENLNDAVKREIKEETNLEVKEVFELNWGSIYECWQGICNEFNFISFVKSENIILNEEHVEYVWLNLEDFIKKIKWDDDKELLKKVLKKALKKERYFNELLIHDYRK
jgi:8-oxo-dGTP pyrophosphatase MutT (NUDIX family)